MRRRRVVLVLAPVAVGIAVTVALLKPSHKTAEIVGPDKRPSLLAPAKRNPLAHVVGSALIPPPASVALPPGTARPLFIDVWASWCVPCREEAPLLSRLATTYRGEIDFRGVDVEDRRGTARAFVERYRLNFPHLFDPKGRTAATLRFFGLPTAYLVDRHGRVAAVLIGKQPEETFRRLLETLRRQSQ